MLEIRGVQICTGKLCFLRGIDMPVGAQCSAQIEERTGRSTLFEDIYAFLLLIFVLMVRPTGLMGRLAKVKA